MGAEKRRSDRVMLTVPLRISGKDARGISFNEDARTVSINRHGACIRIARPLASGLVLRIVNAISQRQADFRVVGPVSPPSEKLGDWGVECVRVDENIWGVHFPPVREGEFADATALVECHQCHTVAVLRMTLVEVEVLETAGILTKPCEKCTRPTSWGVVETRLDMGMPPSAAALTGEGQAPPGPPGQGVNRRLHPRVSMQLPVLVRDYYGGTEVARSNNISKGGFCFVSEKDYRLGQGIVTICPYNPRAPSVEVSAHIVHQQRIEGSNRRMYGVRYDIVPGTK